MKDMKCDLTVELVPLNVKCGLTVELVSLNVKCGLTKNIIRKRRLLRVLQHQNVFDHFQ